MGRLISRDASWAPPRCRWEERARGEGATVPVAVSGQAASGLQGAPEAAKVRQGYP